MVAGLKRGAAIPVAALFLFLSGFPAIAGQKHNNSYGGYAPDTGHAKWPEIWLSDEPSVRITKLKTCPADWKPDCTQEGKPQKVPECKFSLHKIGMSQGRVFYLADAEFSQDYEWNDKAAADVTEGFTCRAQQVELLESVSMGEARPIMRIDLNLMHDLMYFTSADLFNTPQGDVLSLKFHVDGTGGGWEDLYLSKSGSGWAPLDKDETWAAMYKAIPAGYSLHKSPEIDFKTMHWDRAMATKDDPNCCPSGRIDVDLAIMGGRLSVAKYKFETGLEDQ